MSVTLCGQSLCRSKQVKVRLYRVEMSPNPVVNVLTRRRKCGQRHREEDTVRTQRQRLQRGVYKSGNREREDCRQPLEARRGALGTFSLRASRRNQLCQHFDFRLPPSQPPKCEAVNFSCFKPPRSRFFIIAAPGR